MKTLRLTTEEDLINIGLAIDYLEKGRNRLRRASATNAAHYVSQCLKSVRGAYNHAHRAYMRQQREREG